MIRFLSIPLALLFLIGGLLAVQRIVVSFHARQAESFADREVRPFIETWDPEKLIASMPPSVRQGQRLRDNAPILSANFARLGLPSDIGEADGHLRLSFDSGLFPSLTAFVRLEAQFPTGPAQVEADLLKEDGAWYLDQLTVKSDYFVREAQN